MSRQTTFVVLTTQRSGSSWLVDLLNDHPAVAAYAEMFRVTDTTVSDYGASTVPRFEVLVGPDAWSTSKGLARRRYGYVRGLARAHPDAQAVGFKLMYDQTRDHPGLMTGLALARARFIHLVRRNSLSALVSLEIAERHDRWQLREDEAISHTGIRAEPLELVQQIEERELTIERFRRRLAHLPVRVLEIAYEDMLERRDEVLQSVLRFLGVVPAEIELTSSLVKSGRDRLSHVLENYDEVRAALVGTRFDWMVR